MSKEVKNSKKNKIIELAKQWKTFKDIIEESHSDSSYVKHIIEKARENGELEKPKYIEGIDEEKISQLIKPILEIGIPTKEDIENFLKGNVDELEFPVEDDFFMMSAQREITGVEQLLEIIIARLGNARREQTEWWARFYSSHNLEANKYSAIYIPRKLDGFPSKSIVKVRKIPEKLAKFTED